MPRYPVYGSAEATKASPAFVSILPAAMTMYWRPLNI
jgi:hypothetical protein